VSKYDPFEPAYDIRRYELVAALEKLGPRVSTSVVVNGRALLLDAALKLVENLPDDARMGRRGIHIFIDPDPFATAKATAAAPAQVSVPERNADMLTRLIERQSETDRLAEQERRDRTWWRKMGRALTGR
jgi:hypothetical protein